MSLWSKGIERSKTGTVRTEDDKTNPIDEFFANQSDVRSYEITDIKNGVVNVDGSIHLNEDDLDDGELFFKIAKLTGNLYCHCKHIKQSVVPAELGGQIIFVPNEEELWKNKQASTPDEDVLGMGMLTTAPPSQASVTQKFADLISICIANGYDIKIDNIKQRLSNEWTNKDNYQLKVTINKKKRPGYDFYNLTCDVYVSDEEQPLNLTAVEKAFYLAFMVMEEGVTLEDITPAFIDTARKIYSQMPDKTIKSGGLMDENFIWSDNLSRTINGYRKNIRTAIEKQISNKLLVDEFAVEGYKNEPVFVKRATPELRTQIKDGFGLS